MVLDKKIVLCAVCFAPHDEHPEEREDTWNGKLIVGVWAKDYTYIRDFYQGEYVPLCLDHDRDEISDRKMEEIDSEYTYKQPRGL